MTFLRPLTRSAVLGLLSLSLLGACATRVPSADGAGGIYDPYESTNRRVHEFNRGIDRALVRPAARGYSGVLPDDIEASVGNLAENIGQPSVAVNSLLQGDFRGAGLSTSRFLINSVLGFAGLFDVASDFDVPEHSTDFGETLHVWGAGEGAYLELPFVGPSTTRDTVGKVVDLFTNPLTYNLDPPERYIGTVSSVATRLGQRGRYSETVDSILYESADSYAQARLIYLENRRFELGATDASAEIDPFDLDTEGF